MTLETDFTYVIDEIDEDLIDQMFADQIDVDFGGYDGLFFTSTTVEGPNPVAEALAFAVLLEQYGLHVHRAELDLNNQAVIASRCEVSRETVSRWVESGGPVDAFPLPYTSVRAPLWAWSDVHAWLVRNGKPHPHLDWPTASPAQVEDFNHYWRKHLAEQADVRAPEARELALTA
jgi:hypothetical protein